MPGRRSTQGGMFELVRQLVIGCNKNIACANSTVHAMFLLHFLCGPEGPAAGAKRPHAAEGREGERSETVVPEAAD